MAALAALGSPAAPPAAAPAMAGDPRGVRRRTAPWPPRTGGLCVAGLSLDASGTIESAELAMLIDDASGVGVGVGIGLATEGFTLGTIERIGSQPRSFHRLDDANENGFIDDLEQVELLRDESLVPAGFEFNSAADLAAGRSESAAITSSGAAAADDVFVLQDLVAGGGFTDRDETTVRLDGGGGSGTLLDTLRAVAFALPRLGDLNADEAVDLGDGIAVRSAGAPLPLPRVARGPGRRRGGRLRGPADRARRVRRPSRPTSGGFAHEERVPGDHEGRRARVGSGSSGRRGAAGGAQATLAGV